MRRTPLARVSPKRKADQAEYERAVSLVFLRDGGCRAKKLWPEVTCSGRLDPHHILPTGRFPERRCDPDVMRVLCRAHHDAAHSHPELARARGLLV